MYKTSNRQQINKDKKILRSEKAVKKAEDKWAKRLASRKPGRGAARFKRRKDLQLAYTGS